MKEDNSNNDNKETDVKFFDALQGTFRGKLTVEQHVIQFMYMLAIIFTLLFLFSCNFIALSASLNINKNNKSYTKYIYALGAFMFGFMYIIAYLMFFKIGQKNEFIEFDKNKLFP